MNKRKFFKVWVTRTLAAFMLVAIATAAIIGFLLLGKATFKGVIAAADRQDAGQKQYIENHKADNRRNWNKEWLCKTKLQPCQPLPLPLRQRMRQPMPPQTLP